MRITCPLLSTTCIVFIHILLIDRSSSLTAQMAARVSELNDTLKQVRDKIQEFIATGTMPTPPRDQGCESIKTDPPDKRGTSKGVRGAHAVNSTSQDGGGEYRVQLDRSLLEPSIWQSFVTGRNSRARDAVLQAAASKAEFLLGKAKDLYPARRRYKKAKKALNEKEDAVVVATKAMERAIRLIEKQDIMVKLVFDIHHIYGARQSKRSEQMQPTSAQVENAFKIKPEPGILPWTTDPAGIPPTNGCSHDGDSTSQAQIGAHRPSEVTAARAAPATVTKPLYTSAPNRARKRRLP